MSLLSNYKKHYKERQPQEMSIEEYLKKAKEDASYYLSPAGRMVRAIGTPEIIDTMNDPRLNIIFGGKLIKKFEAFSEFFGNEESLMELVGFFERAEQGLEEKNQILYLMGPPAGGKSSVVAKLKELFQSQPFYVIVDPNGEMSPVLESPLALFNSENSEELNIPTRYLKSLPSGWLTKRVEQQEGDLSKFKVRRVYPSIYSQTAIAVTVAGDENNQDISTLVGKGSLRKLEHFDQDDPDCYSYSGALCRGNQGLVDFPEMFKSNIKTLHPLLTATQDHFYEGTEKVGLLPFDGIIIAHSNEGEWDKFRAVKENEALLDRIRIVKVPYCLRKTDEIKIYQKIINQSSLKDAPIVPKTIDYLAEYSILTRLDDPTRDEDAKFEEPSKQNMYRMKHLGTKMRTYDGEDMKDKFSGAASYQDYKYNATHQEGFYGNSVRNAYITLGKAFNYNVGETSADVVTLFNVLRDEIRKEGLSKEKEDYKLSIVDTWLSGRYKVELEKVLQRSFLDGYKKYICNKGDKYVLLAEHWLNDSPHYRDPNTGEMYDKEALNQELESIEKAAKIGNPKDFRQQIVQFNLKYRANNSGKSPNWAEESNPLKETLEATVFSRMEDLLPVISFSGHKSKDDLKKHKNFIERMKEEGYTTEKSIERAVEWLRQRQKR